MEIAESGTRRLGAFKQREVVLLIENKIPRYILKNLRTRRKSQADLARHMCMSRQLLGSKLRTGRFSIDELSRVADFFGRSLTDTITELGVPK